MDNLSNKELFATILSSEILAPYLERDYDLGELLKNPNHPNIHYPQSYAPAKQITPIFRRRLKYMTSKEISLNFEATKQLVTFIEEHPDSQIYNVTFNCAEQHYGVSCGVIENSIHVICAMVGGHIPDDMFGETDK